MSRTDALDLMRRVRATRSRLRQRARAALAADDDQRALSALLQLDQRFAADVWVLESLIEVHRRLRLPEQGLDYVRRCRELPGAPDLTDIHREFERDYELWFRNQTRLANVREWRNAAVDHGLAAASVSEPTEWTLRLLTDAAVEAGQQAQARPVIARMCARQPDNEAFAEMERDLDE